MWAAVRRGVVSGNSHGNPAPKRRGRLCNIAAWLGLPSPGGHPCACPPPSWQLQRQRRLVLAARAVRKGLPHKSVVRIADLEGLWPLLPHHGGPERTGNFRPSLISSERTHDRTVIQTGCRHSYRSLAQNSPSLV